MSAAHESDEPLVGRLYDAALGTVGWEEVLGELVRSFGALCAAFSIVGPHRPGRIVHSGINPAWFKAGSHVELGWRCRDG